MNLNPEINIIILNWNGHSVLDPCIESVLSIHYLNKKLWLVDNGSSDNSAQIIEKYKGINLIKYDTNYGFAKGYNKAVGEMKQCVFKILSSGGLSSSWISRFHSFCL